MPTALGNALAMADKCAQYSTVTRLYGRQPPLRLPLTGL